MILTAFAACDSQVSEHQSVDTFGIKPKVTDVYWDSITIVLAKGRRIDPDSVKKPKTFKIETWETNRVQSNIFLMGVPKVNLINPNSLKSDSGKNEFTLLKTNIAKGKKVSFNYPKPVPAMQAQFKDHAIYNIQHFGIDQGMSSSYVRAILEDSRGNLWIGTYDKGVSLYDGKNFTHFTKKEGLSSNTINTLFEDSKGNIWFGTWGGGASMYNGEYFTHFTEKEGLAENHIYSIFEDREGNIWFGTEGKGVCIYDGKNFRQFAEKNDESNDIVRAITQNIKGNIWIGTFDGGLLKYSKSKSGKESFTRITEKDSLCSDYVRCLYADQKGRLWIDTNNGLDILQGNKLTHYGTDEGLINNIITKIIESKNGDIIIATRGNGVSIFNGKSFSHIGKKEGLSDNIITSVIEDSNGIIWFGTQNGGLNLLNRNSFKHLAQINDANDFPITSVLVDKKENVWYGTSGGGISKYYNETISTYTDKNGLSHNYIYSILEDKSGNIWIGTAGGGVNKYTEKKAISEFTHFGDDEGLSDRLILGILEDKKGNIWFSAKKDGLYCYDGTSFTHYNKTNGLNNNTVFSMLASHDGTLWFGTYGGGINIFDGKNFGWFTQKEGLSDSTIFALYEDVENNIWIGTEKAGILKYKRKKMVQFTQKDGLNSNLVGAISQDHKKRLWLGTNNGLNVLQQDSLGLFQLYSYSKKDGLKGLDFSNPSLFSDKNKQILWANGKNITLIDQIKFELRTVRPKVNLENIDINQEHIDFRRLVDTSYSEQFTFGKDLKNAFSKVAPFTNYPSQLELPYDINHLTFHFSANDRLAPHKIKYSYFMQGLDKEWSIPYKENKADYRNIPPGKYTFKVHAMGESQKWSDVFEYSFIVNHPWWDRWWAYLIYLNLLIVLFYFILRLRTVQLKKRQNELTEMVTERTREIEIQKKKILKQNKKLIKLDEFKQNLTSMIVHDLKNPLSNILTLVDDKENDKNPGNRHNKGLIKNLGNQMLSLLLNILDVNKFEDTKVILNLGNNNIKYMADRAILQTHFLAHQKSINIQNLIPEVYTVNCDQEIVERIFVNLLTNAIKYSPQNKEISIQAEEKDKTKLYFNSNQKAELAKLKNAILISVNDQGMGIDQDKVEHIFDKFGQISGKSSGSIKSTGLGLTFCKLAVEAHAGKIGLISEPQKGTSFWFTLKKAKRVQNTSEIDMLALVTDNKEHLFTKQDIELLSPLVEKLKNIQFYEVTAIKKLLQEHEFSHNIVLQNWKEKLEESVVSCNKQIYEVTLNQGKGL